MAHLDGVWNVHRTGGFLPPLAGVRKRISGKRGVTLVGPVPMSFEVRGSELHYHRPFQSFVDVLEPAGDDRLRGRATLMGKEYGTFELRRVDMAQAQELEQQRSSSGTRLRRRRTRRGLTKRLEAHGESRRSCAKPSAR